MKALKLGTVITIVLLCLSGCAPTGRRSSSLVLLYGAAAALALLMLVCYLLVTSKKEKWMTVLFSCVTVVNSGYFLLSCSGSLDAALWANRISYLGSVFLPISMLMIILGVVGIKPKKYLAPMLIAIGVLVFLLASSYPLLQLYYKDVSLHEISGASHLEKDYGPLHVIYLFYLISYFFSMVAVSIYAAVKRKLPSPTLTVTLCAAVLINICVWLAEQVVYVEFEMLSISYIVTELFLLGLYMMSKENDRLKQLVADQSEREPQASEEFVNALDGLTRTERAIYDLYLEGRSTKEVLSALSIKENTLKFHNKNLYGKLGVKNRKELIQNAKSIK